MRHGGRVRTYLVGTLLALLWAGSGEGAPLLPPEALPPSPVRVVSGPGIAPAGVGGLEAAIPGLQSTEAGGKFGTATLRACGRNLFRPHPTVVGGVEGPAGQATVACRPQSRDRQEAAGHVTIESSTRCTCLLQLSNCSNPFHRRQNVHPAFPPLPAGRGSVGAGGEVMHVSRDVGNTLARLLKPSQGLLLRSHERSSVRLVGGFREGLLSIYLEPKEMTLRGKDASQRFVVMGRFADGVDRDLTASSQLSIVDATRARLEGTARVVALADGQTSLHARLGHHQTEALLHIRQADRPLPFSFGRDVGSILTRRGCNGSDCHGGVKGKGGLKLSLNALHPRQDYEWIVQGGVYQVMSTESGGERRPRINLEEPERSLLLLKPTLGVGHGGGKRLEVDSADYRTLLSWIRQQGPYGDQSEATRRIHRIEVFPPEGVLEEGEAQQILVTARLADGSRQDITDEVLYLSNHPEVVQVSPGGWVQGVSRGETAILIRAPGQVASARFGVIGKRLTDYPETPAAHNFVDEHVFAKLRKFNIVSSGLSSDQEFLRRVCLDVTGTLPPPGRVRHFLTSRDPGKRMQLVDALLRSPEFVDYWTFRFSDLFRVASAATGGPAHAYVYWLWVRDSIAQNKPYDQMARERISAQGYEGASRHFLPFGEEPRAEDIMPEELRVFFGRRLDCAQCHDHPFESWSQDQFWGLAAFFGRISRTEWPGFGPGVIFDDPDGRDPDYGESPESVQVIHPRTQELARPAFLDGTLLASHQASDWRLHLARWVTSHPYFAEAIVNRMWAYFFGRGLVEPVDDFRASNPPTDPALLQALARYFRENGHDLKGLIRLLVQSRAYQLASLPNASNEWDAINYSHHVPRPLDAEILLDAISSTTGVPEIFDNSHQGQAPPGTRAIQLKISDAYASVFLDMYGRPNLERVPERSVKPSLTQALHMLVGSTYTDKLGQKGSRLDGLLKQAGSTREVVEELCLAALARLPSLEEWSGVEKALQRRGDRREVLEDLLWALISSREFTYNH